MKAYISGRISGINQNYARSRFDEAEQLLLSVGFDATFNPMSQGKLDTWEQYMRRDIMELMKCDVIFMLDMWEMSKGATLEHEIAKQIKMPILYETEHRFALNDEIKKIVAKSTMVDAKEITSKSRRQDVFYARMLYAVLLRRCNYTLRNIGAAINREHSTVIYCLKQHDAELEYNADYRRMYKKALAEIEDMRFINLYSDDEI